MKSLKYMIIAASIVLALPLAAQAQVPVEVANIQPMTAGVVKKIDVEQGKITISHGPLLNLDMPTMTMVFRVADPKMLSTVKPGDNIKFVAERLNGAFTVVRVEQAR